MFWDTALDDFTGNFCNEGKYPLISMFKDCQEPNVCSDEPTSAPTAAPVTTPAVTTPAATTPVATTPAATTPAATTPADTAAPDTAAPETAAPDTAAPDTAAPDTAAPDTQAPTGGEIDDNFCQNQSDGFYPTPDCSKYYQCYSSGMTQVCLIFKLLRNTSMTSSRRHHDVVVT